MKKELPHVSYMGFIHQDDPLAEKASSQVAGQVLSQWWDSSEEAGPKRRPQATFPDPLPTLEVLTVQNGTHVKTLGTLHFSLGSRCVHCSALF